MPALRETVREFLVPFKGRDAHFALEATTGWRFVAEELSRAGLTAHLAEPAETATLRGTKRRAKTDRRDRDHMVNLLLFGRLPESSLPPEYVLEIRTLARSRKDLTDQRREWQQRLQAQLFHQGVPSICVATTQGRTQLAEADLSPAGRQVITTGLEVIGHLDRQLAPLDAYLVRFARLQPGYPAITSSLRLEEERSSGTHDLPRSRAPVAWKRRRRGTGRITMGYGFVIAVVIVALLLVWNGVKPGMTGLPGK